MAMTPKNRKMKLTMVRNTKDGEQEIGCRATGVYKGFYIERTSWCSIKDFVPQTFEYLEKMTTGQYNAEIRHIDSLLKS